MLHSKCQLCPAFSYLPTSILTKRPNLVHPLVAIRNYRVILSAVAGIIERNLIKCLHLSPCISDARLLTVIVDLNIHHHQPSPLLGQIIQGIIRWSGMGSSTLHHISISHYLPDLFVIQLLLLVSFRFFSLSLLSDIIDGERELNLIRDESTGKVSLAIYQM